MLPYFILILSRPICECVLLHDRVVQRVSQRLRTTMVAWFSKFSFKYNYVCYIIYAIGNQLRDEWFFSSYGTWVGMTWDDLILKHCEIGSRPR